MTRTKLVNGTRVPLTPAENAERDAEEQAWADKKPQRDVAQAKRDAIKADKQLFDDDALDAVVAELKAGRSKNEELQKAVAWLVQRVR